jgi:glutathione synthase/RimK-type ligase-like ATP-grasp enzyme
MKIAIHLSEDTFSVRWVAYCKDQRIPYKIVDCYQNDILDQLEDCTALMWHFHQANAKATLFAKELMYSVEESGRKVFPDYKTMWHFDDKVGQKYLLEAIRAPMVPSYVFYTKKEAQAWTNNTNFPIVFKLRSGSSSDNVKLVKSKKQAFDLISQAFGKGFTHYDAWPNLKERIRKFKNGKASFLNVSKGFVRLFHTTEFAKVAGREKGYIYFQEFIANNDSDIRIIVIGEKAFAIKRMVRENDFRASGSGHIFFEKELIDLASVKIAFDVSTRLKAQCLAYDFVFKDGKPLIIEISYGFAITAYDQCPGYWDTSLQWHEGKFNPQSWMVDLMINR